MHLYLKIKHRWLCCIIFISFITTIILIYLNLDKTQIKKLNLKYNFLMKNDIYCFRLMEDSLPDISNASPRPGKSIFFHETSCRSAKRGKIVISPRQACSVESAARLNPDLDVYLLYSSPGMIKFEDGTDDESDNLLKVLMAYKNVKILHLNFEKYVKGTPVEDLYTSGKIDRSLYVVSHASDVLRFLTLWKYGGIYLDLDVIVIKPLRDLPLNFAGIESKTIVGSSILSFAPNGFGHTLAKQCLNYLRNNFNGEVWGYNGPELITRILINNCKVDEAIQMIGKRCNGMTVYPKDTFFPIPYNKWNMYFNEEDFDYVKNASKNSHALHIWNKLSSDYKISVQSNVPYLYFAKKFCPNVIETCKNGF